MSSGLSPSRMRRKPAACSKVRGPRPATSSSCWRLRNAPCASRQRTIAAATAGLSPETRASSGTEAVLRSTPTLLTQSSTTASSARASWPWSTSCWYWPTPMLRGSILTSSASGSCTRRAMLTAPRRLTSSSGNSRLASSLAEYTEAPASLTTTRSSRAPAASDCTRRISSAARRSVSRLAVPLPMAISSTPCASTSRASVCSAPSRSRRGSCG